ncbi:MAG TPA: hypothetical protein VNZ26_23205 [Vicinamibacterales bacterium]|jgi:hypothetical protein|nr:hypothetical protein [Vicinamibacterales bacterium]
MVTISISFGAAVVVCLGAVAFVRRKRRAGDKTLNLGTVSQSWLIMHRAEDR